MFFFHTSFGCVCTNTCLNQQGSSTTHEGYDIRRDVVGNHALADRYRDHHSRTQYCDLLETWRLVDCPLMIPSQERLIAQKATTSKVGTYLYVRAGRPVHGVRLGVDSVLTSGRCFLGKTCLASMEVRAGMSSGIRKVRRDDGGRWTDGLAGWHEAYSFAGGRDHEQDVQLGGPVGVECQLTNDLHDKLPRGERGHWQQVGVHWG